MRPYTECLESSLCEIIPKFAARAGLKHCRPLSYVYRGQRIILGLFRFSYNLWRLPFTAGRDPWATASQIHALIRPCLPLAVKTLKLGNNDEITLRTIVLKELTVENMHAFCNIMTCIILYNPLPFLNTIFEIKFPLGGQYQNV